MGIDVARSAGSRTAARPSAPIAAATPGAAVRFLARRRAIGLEPGKPSRIPYHPRIGHQRISSAASTPISPRPFLIICPIPRASSSRARESCGLFSRRKRRSGSSLPRFHSAWKRGRQIIEIEGDPVRLMGHRRALDHARILGGELDQRQFLTVEQRQVGLFVKRQRPPPPPCACSELIRAWAYWT